MCNHSHVLYIAYTYIYTLTNTHIIGCPSKDSPIWPIKLPVVLVALISSQNVDLFCLVIKSTGFWIQLLLSIFEHLLLLTYLFWYITKQNYILLLRVVFDFGFLGWTGKKRGTLQYEYFAVIGSRNFKRKQLRARRAYRMPYAICCSKTSTSPGKAIDLSLMGCN